MVAMLTVLETEHHFHDKDNEQPHVITDSEEESESDQLITDRVQGQQQHQSSKNEPMQLDLNLEHHIPEDEVVGEFTSKK
jgi:hypothetical protein